MSSCINVNAVRVWSDDIDFFDEFLELKVLTTRTCLHSGGTL